MYIYACILFAKSNIRMYCLSFPYSLVEAHHKLYYMFTCDMFKDTTKGISHQRLLSAIEQPSLWIHFQEYLLTRLPIIMLDMRDALPNPRRLPYCHTLLIYLERIHSF